MNINTTTIVSNSDMIKHYKGCRGKAEMHGKTFVIKNNLPDAVLFSISEYQKFSKVFEYLEGLDEKEIAQVLSSLSKSCV